VKVAVNMQEKQKNRAIPSLTLLKACGKAKTGIQVQYRLQIEKLMPVRVVGG
jgi:hypothetical protein